MALGVTIQRVWEPLRTGRFTSARLALHWAAQVPSAAGATLVAPREDSGQTALAWDHAKRALANETGAALLVESFAVAFGDRTIPLDGLTLDDAIARLAEAMGSSELRRPAHELPDHPVAHGAAFVKPDAGDLAELARWYGNAHQSLAPLGDVRCWPHHFDIAALVVLDRDAPLETARSIGAGMSPGDGSYDEPYYYVTPYPFRAGAELPSVEPGEWRKEGWQGAVLRAAAVIDGQEGAVRSFLDQAMAASRAMLSP